MRFLLILPLLAIAACARVPAKPESPAVPTPSPQPREGGALIGLTANEVVNRLGKPALQIREGNSFKLQYRGSRCVLDAFLYPAGGGQHRVTHVEARTPAGTDTSQPDCVRSLEYPG